jgi:stage V sporulation protein SpoVS
MAEERGNTETTDETLLLVSGNKNRTKEEEKEYVKKLANATLQVYEKHGLARLRCCGAASVNNGVKAFIIANNDAELNNKNLRADMTFTTVEFQGDTKKTGILIEVTQDICVD